MTRPGSLRGHGAFDQAIRRGERFEGRILHSFLLVHRCSVADLRAGFAVPRRTGNAVRRNRVRRLMREAFRGERTTILKTLQTTQTSASIVFLYKGHGDRPVERLTLAPLRADMSLVCARMAAVILRRSA